MPISVRRGRSYGTVSSDAVAFLERRGGDEASLHQCPSCGGRRFRVVASDCQAILTCVGCDSLSVVGTARTAAQACACECGRDEFAVAVAKTRDGAAAAGRCSQCTLLQLFAAGRSAPVQLLSGVNA